MPRTSAPAPAGAPLSRPRPARALALAAATCLIAGCEFGESTGPQVTQGPAVESLTIASPTLPADGRAATVVRAVIPPESRVRPRSVTFSTTAGAFQPGVADSMRVTVSVDEEGEAVALLRAPVTPGLAVVRATAGGETLQDEVQFVPAAADLASLTVAADSAAADSVSTLLVRAVIPRSSTARRTVTFQTTHGSFRGDTDTITVEADSTGTATALLRAPAAPGLALVSARAGNTVLQDTVRFFRAPPDLLSLALGADSLQADGASTVLVRAMVRRGTARAPATVTFTTTSGVFAGDSAQVTVRVDSSGTATALLRAPRTPGLALVRARAGNAALDATFRFIHAYPETIVLSADSFRVAATPASRVEVTATLRRMIGSVSPGTTVSFAAVTRDTVPVGWFSGETPSDSTGVAEATYTPGSTSYRGPVTIIATARGANGGVVRGMTTIEISDPQP